MDTLELLLHPVRLRIVYALSGGHTRTTADLCASLSDVPKTTVYRHVGLLADGGVLEVADEQRVRGAVERHYRLRQDRPRIGPEAGESMSPNDHREAFAATMAVLLSEFNAYLDRPGSDPYADKIGYRQGIVWLSDEEITEAAAALQRALGKIAENGPRPGRRPRLLSLIQFPTAESPGDSCDGLPDPE